MKVTATLEIWEIICNRYGINYWDEVPGFPVEDWQSEVLSEDTRMGYHEWVSGQIDDEGV